MTSEEAGIGENEVELIASDVARMLGVSKTTVYKLERSGQLTSRRVGKMNVRVFDRREVERLEADRRHLHRTYGFDTFDQVMFHLRGAFDVERDGKAGSSSIKSVTVTMTDNGSFILQERVRVTTGK